MQFIAKHFEGAEIWALITGLFIVLGLTDSLETVTSNQEIITNSKNIADIAFAILGVVLAFNLLRCGLHLLRLEMPYVKILICANLLGILVLGLSECISSSNGGTFETSEVMMYGFGLILSWIVLPLFFIVYPDQKTV